MSACSIVEAMGQIGRLATHAVTAVVIVAAVVLAYVVNVRWAAYVLALYMVFAATSRVFDWPVGLTSFHIRTRRVDSVLYATTALALVIIAVGVPVTA